MVKIRLLAAFNAFTLLAHVFSSYSIKFGWFADQTVGQIANSYGSLITPAAMTYGIWEVIYTSLAVFCVYHLYTAFRKNEDHTANRDISDIGVAFIVSNIASTAWLFMWTGDQILGSLLLMVLQLISLVVINVRLKIHDENRKFISKAITQFPFSIYFAWITVLTFANASTYLIASNWTGLNLGLSVSEWTIIMITFLIMISVLVIITRRNVSYGLVIIWALYGIILRGQENDGHTGVMETAWMGTGVVSLTCLTQMIRNFVYENTLNQEVPDYAENEEPAPVAANPTETV